MHIHTNTCKYIQIYLGYTHIKQHREETIHIQIHTHTDTFKYCCIRIHIDADAETSPLPFVLAFLDDAFDFHMQKEEKSRASIFRNFKIMDLSCSG